MQIIGLALTLLCFAGGLAPAPRYCASVIQRRSQA